MTRLLFRDVIIQPFGHGAHGVHIFYWAGSGVYGAGG